MAMTLTPSDAMASAAKRGLALVADGRAGGGLEPATKARAKKIAAKEELSPEHVKRMASFFARHSIDRKSDWGKKGSETPGYVAWQLWGGDAGKAWSSSKVKQLSEHGVEMDEINEEDEELDLEEFEVTLSDDGPSDFAELFFADSKSVVAEDDDGLIWKPMLPVGVWKIGPNGRPLKVVAGKSKDQRAQIGMQDVIEAFNANAVPHVTIPLSHDDKVDENTGYLRKLKIATHNGIKTLFGGHEFTDQKVKSKVLDRSIANTSVGLEFDYVRKDDGKKFPVVLRHNALTNRPWLGRKLAPFGLAEEEADNFTVMCGEYSEPLSDDEEVVTTPDEDKETSGSQDTIQTSEVPDATTNKEPVMGAENEKEKETPATPAPTVDLSEHPDFVAEREKNARLKAQLDQLAAKDRKREADDFVGTLKEMGFTEEKGCTAFLKKAHAIQLADEGETAILLSEDGQAAPRPMSVAAVVKELFESLPTEQGKSPVATQLSEQQTDPLGESKDNKPPVEDETDLTKMSEEQKRAAADAWFNDAFGVTTSKES